MNTISLVSASGAARTAMPPERPLPFVNRKLAAAIAALGHGLIEREREVRLVFLAALAGEHTLLVGPPGTAKSELARRLHLAFGDAGYFERLLTRFCGGSDGEFGATPQTAAALEVAKAKQGLRVQGILVGDRETIGFLEIADDIFWLRDWRHFGGVPGDSPVHSKSLTATYFPGSLRSPANRAATVVWGQRNKDS